MGNMELDHNSSLPHSNMAWNKELSHSIPMSKKKRSLYHFDTDSVKKVRNLNEILLLTKNLNFRM